MKTAELAEKIAELEERIRQLETRPFPNVYPLPSYIPNYIPPPPPTWIPPTTVC